MNKVVLVGRLGADPELRYTQNQAAVCSFSFATTEGKDKTEWHRIVCFEKTAELVSQYLTKGSQAAIDGRLQTRKWMADDGTERYTTEVVANRVEFLGGKNDAHPQGTGDEPPRPQSQKATAAASQSANYDNDSEIPF